MDGRTNMRGLMCVFIFIYAKTNNKHISACFSFSAMKAPKTLFINSGECSNSDSGVSSTENGRLLKYKQNEFHCLLPPQKFMFFAVVFSKRHSYMARMTAFLLKYHWLPHQKVVAEQADGGLSHFASIPIQIFRRCEPTKRKRNFFHRRLEPW